MPKKNNRLEKRGDKNRMLVKKFSRCFVVCGCLFVLSGCVSPDEPMIVDDSTVSGSKSVQPKSIVTEPLKPAYPKAANRNVPRDWFPPSGLEKNWTAIVIHHSATDSGDAAIFDKWHREGNDWEGVGYDFVIGNGTDSDDGQVEVTFRWRQQLTGAHCKTPNNWANEDAVGICLVGNFNNTVPTSRQMRSLVKLVEFLQQRYGIPEKRIYGHNTTPGARITDCPGKRFSMTQLKSMLAR
jgi:hypothetical protein